MSEVERTASIFNSVCDSLVSMSPGRTTKGKHCTAQQGKCSEHSSDVQRGLFSSTGGHKEKPEVLVCLCHRERGGEIEIKC